MPNYPLPRQSWLIPGFLALLTLLSACGDSATTGNTPPPVQPTPTATQPTPTPAPQRNKVGQVVKIGQWEVTVNSIKSSPGGNGVTTDADKQFVIINVTLHNTGSTALQVSSQGNFTLKQSDGTKAQDASFANTLLNIAPAPDGTVAGGDKLKGDLLFAALKTEKALTLLFSPEAGSTEQAIWDLSL